MGSRKVILERLSHYWLRPQAVVRNRTRAGLGAVKGLVHKIGVCGGAAWVYCLRMGRVQGCHRPCTQRDGMQEVGMGGCAPRARAQEQLSSSGHRTVRIDHAHKLSRTALHENVTVESSRPGHT